MFSVFLVVTFVVCLLLVSFLAFVIYFLPVCRCVRGGVPVDQRVTFGVCILCGVECLQGLLGVLVIVRVC